MPHTRGRVADSRHAYKSFSRLEFGHPVAAPLPPSKGSIHPTAIRVLRAFTPPSLSSPKLRSSLAIALSAHEIIERTGLPRSTVYYHLAKLVRAGLLARAGKPRSPSSLYVLTVQGVRVLASSFSLSALESVQTTVQTTRAGPTLCVDGDFGKGKPLSMERAKRGKKFAKTIRVVPLPPLALRWWVELDGKVPGFRELGFRLPARRLLRWLKGLGLLERRRRRVKRILVYLKGKEVHVDVATSLAPDEIQLLGPSAHWRDYVFAFTAVSAACLAAGVDKRLLHSLLAALRV